MNTEQENKYSVAWFSLSECIARGEREKALGVFRLLSHSLTDKALVHQLKGDIYIAFQDNELALQEYVIAAQEYLRQNRFQPASALYEYIVYAHPKSLEYSFLLLSLYYELGVVSRAHEEFVRISEQLCKKESFELLCSTIERVKNKDYAISFYCDIIRQLLSGKSNDGYVQMCLSAMLDELIISADQNKLQHFLQTLESIDLDLHRKASGYIKS